MVLTLLLCIIIVGQVRYGLVRREGTRSYREPPSPIVLGLFTFWLLTCLIPLFGLRLLNEHRAADRCGAIDASFERWADGSGPVRRLTAPNQAQCVHADGTSEMLDVPLVTSSRAVDKIIRTALTFAWIMFGMLLMWRFYGRLALGRAEPPARTSRGDRFRPVEPEA